MLLTSAVLVLRPSVPLMAIIRTLEPVFHSPPSWFQCLVSAMLHPVAAPESSLVLLVLLSQIPALVLSLASTRTA